MAALEPGTRIDRYEIEDRIGSGGMAIVYRVRHAQLGTSHALKVLEVPSRAVQERLLQEGRVQASLRHPNIVAVTDVISVEGAPGLVMELINGPTLDQLLRTCPLTLDQVDAIALQLLAGVEAAHDHGVVHRDLKPSNVMIEVQRSEIIAKVADFGLVKVLNEDVVSDYATRSGMTMGTPSYMSPEQIRDAKHVDHRTDIFSLGCVLYDLVCGQRAFSGKDTLDIFRAVDESRYVPPLQVRPDLPRRMHDAIVGALQVDREARTPDCAALRRAWLGEHLSPSLPRLPTEEEAWPSPMIERVRAMGSGRAPTGGGARAAAQSLTGQTFDGFDLPPNAGQHRAASTLVAESAATSQSDGAATQPAPSPSIPVDSADLVRLPRRRTAIVAGAGILAALVVLAVGAGIFFGGGPTKVDSDPAAIAEAEGVAPIEAGEMGVAPGEVAEVGEGQASQDEDDQPIAPIAEPPARAVPSEAVREAAPAESTSPARPPPRTLSLGARAAEPPRDVGEAATDPSPVSAPPADPIGPAPPVQGRVKLEVSGSGPFSVSLFQGSEPTGQLGGPTRRIAEVVPGEHTAYCTFGTDAPTQCAVMAVRAGQTRTLRCDTGLRNCKVL